MYLIPRISAIREKRLEANLSQHMLSLKAGLGGQAINRIEREETNSVHPLRAKAIVGSFLRARKRGFPVVGKSPLGCRLFCFTVRAVRRRSAPFSLPGIPAP